MNKSDSISVFQLILLSMTFIGLKTHVMLISPLIKTAGRDAWITVLLTCLLTLIWVPLLVYVNKKTKGEDLTNKAVERYVEKLHLDNLPAPSFLDHLVTTSTFSPFSDKLMLFHKMDMFSMKMRAFGNSVAVNGRHDLALLYGKSMTNISRFVYDAAAIMMENGWMETPPEAVDRDHLNSN